LHFAFCLLTFAFFSACQRADRPAGQLQIPSDLSIGVEINGGEVEAITATRLQQTKVDYSDDDHHAWRLSSLLPPGALTPDMEIEVEQADGTRTILAHPGDTEAQLEPVLMVNRKGAVLVALVDRSNPFPAFHGRGGNRGQGGPKENRIRGVTRLRLNRVGS
jgi:hypothetical protein